MTVVASAFRRTMGRLTSLRQGYGGPPELQRRRKPAATNKIGSRAFLAVTTLACALMACGPSADETAASNRHLLIILDGLRPDYITPEVMPHLHALGQRGVVFANHHSVYPTVTRLNASSISTGAYPGTHGLMGNSVFFPQVDPARFLDTGNRENLLKINEAVRGDLLTTPTLGEILQAAGKKVLAVGSGTSGSTFLLNHKVAGGAVLHTEFALPEPLRQETLTQLGPTPAAGTPNDARNRRAVEAFLKIGLPTIDPSVTLMWLSDPDTTAHRHGIGHPTSVEALRRVDAEIKHVQDGLAAAGVLDRYNIWVTSDHGFSTHTGGINLEALVKPFAGTLADGSPRIVTGGGAIYVRDGDREIVSQIVSVLQRTGGVGAIFTRPAVSGSLDGAVAGTLSFDAAYWNHARSADILFSPDWTDEKNEYGFAGKTASNGVAGHGSASPFDIHNVLLAAGPDLQQGAALTTPSGNVDFAPTFLHLLGVPIPQSMQGRVLLEALRSGPDPPTLATRSVQHTVSTADKAYTATSYFSIVDSGRATYRYLDYAKATRGRQ